ncbi:hypothetical protein COV23_02005 [Candidatus Wolfebacteria bacterium CG10_big_fil_rev_8_21_14_0_10_31_9]|uniref:DUF5652 domain-containing protein n=1 Tax=Candidatus Wolfebacteria bacterium CG10_big_fil_rev_8_21_14_0_10_31_9 TaxID=1975070 RepID=A0A2H0RDZ6_9BACT|nr:MAG: hypothetical protein COV23_02005 [Candidatus Wolfebacteria bacterium CG10_big_fil_rev_8_21_14_0_10_31_9]
MIKQFLTQNPNIKIAGPYIAIFAVLFAVLMVWSIIWKGLALWKAAKNGSIKWFIVLLVVNTMGILEILYIYVFSKRSNRE